MQWLIKRLALASLLCTTGASLSACSSEPEETGVDESQIRDEFAQTAWKTVEYTVRGEVAALPSGDEDLQVRHEAIPEFRSGAKMGMNVMTMPFPLAEGVSLDGVEPGDKLSITFSVDYEEGWSPIGYRVVSYEQLPADTALDFTPLPSDGASE